VFFINPLFITGFSYAESCFTLGISPSKLQAVFQISLHVNDRALLEDIKTSAPPFPPHIILKKNLGGEGGAEWDIFQNMDRIQLNIRQALLKIYC
jgi:hypothetical protein